MVVRYFKPLILLSVRSCRVAQAQAIPIVHIHVRALCLTIDIELNELSSIQQDIRVEELLRRLRCGSEKILMLMLLWDSGHQASGSSSHRHRPSPYPPSCQTQASLLPYSDLVPDLTRIQPFRWNNLLQLQIIVHWVTTYLLQCSPTTSFKLNLGI